MNPSFPDWNTGTQLPVLTPKNKTFGLDGELVELLWENGQVVLHAQTHHHPKPGPEQPPNNTNNDSRFVCKHVTDQSVARGGPFSCENPVNGLIQDTETVSWIDCPVDDPFDKEFTSNFLAEFPQSNPMDGLDEPGKSMDHRRYNFASNPPLPQRFFTCDHSHLEGISKTATAPEPVKQADIRSSFRTRGEVGEYSVKTFASSHCGSNQVITDAAEATVSAAVPKDDTGKISSPSDKIHTQTLETAITSSSSDASHSSFGMTSNQSRGTSSHKRKSRDAEDSECQSKDAELESAPRKKPSLKSRRSRAAEVHNLSERRRRDRINEKMRILQELLPHSNKTDKASMLDEAIEYMKSLQLQLQMMWMGTGMAPFMFPGVQHCMSRFGMGIGPLPLPHNPMQFSRLPLVNPATIQNQAAVFQTSMLNKLNYQSQLQNPNIPQQYANYMRFPPLQSAAQQINVFSFGPKTAPGNQMPAPPGNNGPSYVG